MTWGKSVQSRNLICGLSSTSVRLDGIFRHKFAIVSYIGTRRDTRRDRNVLADSNLRQCSVNTRLSNITVSQSDLRSRALATALLLCSAVDRSATTLNAIVVVVASVRARGSPKWKGRVRSSRSRTPTQRRVGVPDRRCSISITH